MTRSAGTIAARNVASRQLPFTRSENREIAIGSVCTGTPWGMTQAQVLFRRLHVPQHPSRPEPGPFPRAAAGLHCLPGWLVLVAARRSWRASPAIASLLGAPISECARARLSSGFSPLACLVVPCRQGTQQGGCSPVRPACLAGSDRPLLQAKRFHLFRKDERDRWLLAGSSHFLSCPLYRTSPSEAFAASCIVSHAPARHSIRC